jgi:hypothetical protein
MVKRIACFIALVAICTATVTYTRAYGETVTATDLQAKGKSSMSQETTLGDLFDRWERVWHEGQYDLISGCIPLNCIRHDEVGEGTVTREAYAAEIAKTRQERPRLRFVVYDHTFQGDRAWFRFTLKWTDSNTGETRTRAGMAGQLAETWLMFRLLSSAWPDAVAQKHWTSPPPSK